MARDVTGIQCLVATPFTEDGSAVDEASFRNLVDYVIDRGVDGIVAMGRAGEFESLSMDERRRLMTVTAEHVAGRVPAGIGIINAPYDEGLALGRLARDAGLDYVMSRSPNDGDVMTYFRELTAIVPVMVYDEGARGELSVKDVLAPLIRECANIVAVKVSSEPDKIVELKQAVAVPTLCGWDMMSLIAYENGADGVISGFAGVFPENEVKLLRAVKEGRLDEARQIFYVDCLPALLHLTFDPFAFSAAKYVLSWRGIIRWPTTRTPFVSPLSERRQAELRYVLESGRVGFCE